jgi:purine-binding chemotaxis protein CheW
MMQAVANNDLLIDAHSVMLVTMRIDQQLFGVPVQHVRDVLREQKVARIPLASPEIEGSINLRGRIVTVINLRKRLKLEPKQSDARHMFVVVEYQNELYSLMVDSVGDVMTISEDRIEKSPANLSPNWREVAVGITRLQDDLLVVIDTSSLLAITA